MRRAAVLAILVCSPALALDLVAATNSDRYRQVEIPGAWIPAEHAKAIQTAAEYPRAAVRSVRIVDFVRIYGAPSRLVSPQLGHGDSFLIYDLRGGYEILLWVPSVESGFFSAAQLYRPDGQPQGPLLK